MSSMFPLKVPPGVVKTRSGEGAVGRWSDAENVRFVAGHPEKRKGFEQLNTALLSGIARGMDAWNKHTGAPLYAVGTNTKLYGSIDGEDVIDITPLRYQTSLTDDLSITINRGAITADFASLDTGTLSNPFTTVNLSATVTVAHPSHGHITGDKVFYSGASAVGGITIAGIYAVTVTGSGSYTIVHSAAASSSATGGGTVSFAWPRWAIGRKFLIRGNSFEGGSHVGGVFMEDEYEIVSIVDGDSYIIFPTRGKTTLGSNPFSTTNLSPTIVVIDLAHGLSTGDVIWVNGPANVGGLAIDGEYVITVLTNDTYQITHGSNATSTATGGTGTQVNWAEAATFTETQGGGTVFYMTYLTNPFTTTNLSTTVTVAHADHGAVSGDTIHVDGATASGGITIDGDYEIVLVVDEDSYTIVHSSAATSSATGGGTAVVIEYDIVAGSASAFTSDRDYGEGDYGADLYGTTIPANDPTYYEPRSWAIDKTGEDAIMSYLGGGIYYWDSSLGGRADLIPGAPTGLRYAFQTPERHLHALGIGGDPLLFGWSSQGDLDDWEPDELDTASYRRVTEGSALIAGTSVSDGVNLIWTDTASYVHQFTGGAFVYNTRLDAKGAGLIGPQAFAVAPMGAFWMSQTRFKMWNGSTQDIPNAHDVDDWVYESLDPGQRSKCFAHYDAVNNSVDFYFATTGQAEPNRYVTLCLDDFSWTVGTQTRTTGATFDAGLQLPIRVGTNGKVYTHEVGLDADGVAAPSSLSLAPYEIGQNWSEVLGLDPDFKRQVGNVELSISTYDRNVSNVVDTETATIDELDEMVDLRSSGRHISLVFSQTVLAGDWALDTPQVDIRPSATRR